MITKIDPQDAHNEYPHVTTGERCSNQKPVHQIFQLTQESSPEATNLE